MKNRYPAREPPLPSSPASSVRCNQVRTLKRPYLRPSIYIARARAALTICRISIIFFMRDSVCLLVSSKLLRVCA